MIKKVIFLLIPIIVFGISFQNNYFIENPALAVRNGIGIQTYYSPSASSTDFGVCVSLLSNRLFYLNGKFSYSSALGLNGLYLGYDSKGIYGIAYKNDDFYFGLSDSTSKITDLSTSIFSLQAGLNYNSFYLNTNMTIKGTDSKSFKYSIGGGINLYDLNFNVDYSPKDFLSLGAFYQNKYFGFGGDYILKYGSIKNVPSYKLYLSVGNWVENKKEPYFLFYSIDSFNQNLLDRTILSLNKYKNDNYCKGILIRLANLKESLTNLGVVEELRSSLKSFEKSGKKVVFYLDGDSSFLTYYLASSGNKIYMPSLSNLYSLGYTLDIYKDGDFFKMLGINIDEITAGKYKSTMHPTVSQLSEDQKDAMTKVVNDIYNKALYDISQDRAIDPTTLETFMNGQMIDANVAKDNKLIDSVGYFSDALDEFQSYKMVAFNPHIRSLKSSLFVKNIYVLPIYGTIVQGEDTLVRGYVTDEWVVDRLSEIERDPNAGAVILRINSPGGSAIASEHIWRKLDELRRRGIYTIASMEGVAASGGYYIASGCDTIVANPMTITGNIGVVYQIIDYSSLLDKLKIREYTIKTGFYDDMYNGTRPLTADERSKIQKVVDNSYNLFLKRVSQGRRIPFEDLQKIADGKIYTGDMAKSVKLVDNLGGLNDAVNIACDYLNESVPNLIYISNIPSTFDLIMNFISPFEFMRNGLYMY